MGLRQELDREFVGITRPDLWAEIESRATRRGPTELPAADGEPGGPPRERLVAAVVALLVILGAVAILWSAFRSAPPRPGDTPPSPTGIGPGPRRNGEIIQFENVAGSSAVDLAAQDPRTGQLRLFADTSAALDCSYVRGEDCSTSVGRAAWSADGRWVAFEALRGWEYGVHHPNRAHSIPVDAKEGLWVVGVERHPRQVAGLCASCHPRTTDLVWAWGPAGTGIAYASRRFGDGELFVFDPSEGTRRSLGRVDGRITALSWSPDGSRIALAASGALYLVDPGSGARSRIATYQGISEEMWSGGWPAGITWSPDGTKFALVTHSTGGAWTWNVRILTADGMWLADLPVPGGGSFIQDPDVAWSPDGTRIAYTVYYRQTPGPRNRRGMQVWMVGSFGHAAQKVFDPGCCGTGSPPAWSPDGSRLGFTYWAVAGERQGLVVDIYDNGTGGEAHAIDERVIQSWRGGSFSSEGWAPGKLG
jgi:hypothetical protein